MKQNLPAVEDKPTLVFLPGWASAHHTWRRVSRRLEAQFHIIFIELPYILLDEKNDSVFDLTMCYLEEKIPQPSILIGWSLGGMLAQCLSERVPEKVVAVVNVAANLKFVADASWPEAMPKADFDGFCLQFQRAPEKALSRFCALQAKGHLDARSIAQTLREHLCVTDENAVEANKMLTLLTEIDNSRLRYFKVPQLFIFGDKDRLCPAACAEKISNCANTQVKVIKDSGHAPHVSDSALLAESIANFASDHKQNLDRELMRYHKSKQRIARSFGRASNTYDASASLQKKVAASLCKWAPTISGRILDAGCGTGFCSDILFSRRHVESITALDLAPEMLAKTRQRCADIPCIAGDIECLPFLADSFDAVVSSLAVQWCEKLSQVFSEAKRVLVPGGQFLMSSLGPETLFELNASWAEADTDYVHVNRFTDTDEVLAAAKELGFSIDLFGSESHVLHYQKLLDLMRELKALGAHNVNTGNHKGLTGKKTIERLYEAYEKFRVKGKLPATYHVQYWLFSSPKR